MDVAPAERWFASKGWAALDFQREVWRTYLDGGSGLVHAATGTGKTLAAWWGPLLEWMAETGGSAARDATRPRLRRAAAPPLRVVPPARRRPAARAPFMLLIAGLLTAGLLCLLMLNTVLAEGAFVLDRLEVRSNALTDTEQALEQKLAITSSPQELTKRATAMGMVPSTNPVFIRASDGKILGVPEAGKKPTPAPEAKPQPKPAASVPQPAASPAPRAATDTEAQ